MPNVHAIVLRRKDSGESDRRLTILTPEFGRIDVVAKGARKAASRLGSTSEPLTVAVMTLAEGKHTKFVTQVQPVASFRGIRSDFDRLSLALALLELCSAILPFEEPAPEAYDLLLATLSSLDVHAKPLAVVAWAEVRLLELTGFQPQLSECVVTGKVLSEAHPYLSPQAGGYVCDDAATGFNDRVRVRAEVVYALHQLAGLEAPPPNLKFAAETVLALQPFWRMIVDGPLPANDAVLGELRLTLSAG